MRVEPGRSRITVAAVLAVLAGLCAPSAASAEEFLYYVEDGAVVITNTQQRADARPLPGWTSAGLPRPSSLPGTPWDGFIERVAGSQGLDPDLVKAVAWVESAFDPRAVSPKGAVGLMQLMPATAERYGVRDRTDPYESLQAGTRHLRDLLDEFDGDLTLALAAYNAGSGAVRRSGGVPAFAETRSYVKKVRNRMAGTTPRPDREPVPDRPIVRETASDGRVVFTN